MRISDWSSYVFSSDLPWGWSRRKRGTWSSPARCCRLRSIRSSSSLSTASRDGCDDDRGCWHCWSGEAMRAIPVCPTRSTARSEEHTSELQSLMRISYAVFCLNKKNTNTITKRVKLQDNIRKHTRNVTKQT